MSEQNGVQSLLDKYAWACLADFLRAASDFRSVVSIVRSPNATIIVAAFPPLPDHDVPDMTECDQAILTTLLAGRSITVAADDERGAPCPAPALDSDVHEHLGRFEASVRRELERFLEASRPGEDTGVERGLTEYVGRLLEELQPPE